MTSLLNNNNFLKILPLIASSVFIQYTNDIFNFRSAQNIFFANLEIWQAHFYAKKLSSRGFTNFLVNPVYLISFHLKTWQTCLNTFQLPIYNIPGISIFGRTGCTKL